MYRRIEIQSEAPSLVGRITPTPRQNAFDEVYAAQIVRHGEYSISHADGLRTVKMHFVLV
jgi:hypothetical protein